MPELTGTQFILRPYREGDADALARAANNPAIAANLVSSFPSPYTREDANAWIASCLIAPQEELRLAIDIRGSVSGGIGLYPRPLWSPYVFEMGYWLAEDHWGRGIVSEAVGLVVGYGFEAMNATRIQAFVYDWNLASARVLEKNEFQFEGRLRNAVHKDGRTGDCLAYGRLR